VNFKVFGLLPLTVLFAVSQIRLMQRHMVEERRRRMPCSLLEGVQWPSSRIRASWCARRATC
jgi:hypothetical protein